MKSMTSAFINRVFKLFEVDAHSPVQQAEKLQNQVVAELTEALLLAQNKAIRENAPSIHAIRVTLKRVRAYWRLIRFVVSPEVFKTADQRIRLTGKRLAGHRDLQVMLESLKQIESLMEDSLIDEGVMAYLEGLKQALKQKIQDQADSESLPQIEWSLIETALQQELTEWQALKFSKAFTQDVKAGFKATLDACHQYALPAIIKGASPEERHEWRKWVKHGYYQLKLLQVIGEPKDSAKAKVKKESKSQKIIYKLDQLGNLLGKEHDFELLYFSLKARKKILKDSLKSLLKSPPKSNSEALAQDSDSATHTLEQHERLLKMAKTRLGHLKKQVNHLHAELLKSW